MSYLLYFVIAAFFSVCATFVVRMLALRFSIVDTPRDERKHHQKPIALLGGAAAFISFVLAFFTIEGLFENLFLGYLLPKHVVAIVVSGLILIIGGFLDDRYDLKPLYQIFFPIFAAIVVVMLGVGIEYISNPFGEAVDLTSISFTVFEINGLPYQIVLFADLFAIVWLLGMTYATKTFDGLDGLVSGVVVIASIVLILLSLSEGVMQPETAVLAAILGGSFFGFLVWNFPPAKIFLGEGGSTLAGFMIGLLAIISGGKLATALLIMSIPILDLAFVIFERIFKKESPFRHADRKHVHMRLLDSGWSVRRVLSFMYVLVVFLGVIALQFEGRLKIFLLSGFSVFFIAFLVFLLRKSLRSS